MTVISSSEFFINQNRYFDMAIEEEVCIQSGDNMFQLRYTPIEEVKRERVYFEPDEDFYNSVTKDELLKGIHEDIDVFFL